MEKMEASSLQMQILAKMVRKNLTALTVRRRRQANPCVAKEDGDTWLGRRRRAASIIEDEHNCSLLFLREEEEEEGGPGLPICGRETSRVAVRTYRDEMSRAVRFLVFLCMHAGTVQCLKTRGGGGGLHFGLNLTTFKTGFFIGKKWFLGPPDILFCLICSFKSFCQVVSYMYDHTKTDHKPF